MNWRVVAVVAAAIALIAVVIYLIGGLPKRGGDTTLPPTPTETTTTAEEGASGASITEDTRAPFTFSVKAKEGKATEVKIITDDVIAYEGTLTSGDEQSFDGVLEAKITISQRKNATVTQNGTNIPIPEDGELTLELRGD